VHNKSNEQNDRSDADGKHTYTNRDKSHTYKHTYIHTYRSAASSSFVAPRGHVPLIGFDSTIITRFFVPTSMAAAAIALLVPESVPVPGAAKPSVVDESACGTGETRMNRSGLLQHTANVRGGGGGGDDENDGVAATEAAPADTGANAGGAMAGNVIKHAYGAGLIARKRLYIAKGSNVAVI
jgi:hypothetical protein